MGGKNGKLKLSSRDLNFYQDILKFSEKEIAEWHREFKKSARTEHGEIFLTEEDFIKVYSNVFEGDSSDYCRHIVRTFDKNRNGKVTFTEFLMGLHASGSENPDTNMKWAFDVYDVNMSGAISKPEMVDVVKAVYKMLDPDQSTIEPEYRTPEMVVETMFAAMDTNNDDLLTWEEFRDGVTKDPFLLNLLQCNPPSATTEASKVD